MYCPSCGEKYKWYESECPNCQVALLEVPAGEAPNPAVELVSVLETTEAGVLPLARLALEQEGIEYAVQNRGLSDQIFGRRSSMTVGETDTPLYIVVRAEDESRAREVLRDLASADASTAAPATAGASAATERAAATEPRHGDVTLEDETGASIGRLTAAQFESLSQHLVRESDEDTDYYLDEATLTMLTERGVEPAVIDMLRRALGPRPDVTVRWRRVEGAV